MLAPMVMGFVAKQLSNRGSASESASGNEGPGGLGEVLGGLIGGGQGAGSGEGWARCSGACSASAVRQVAAVSTTFSVACSAEVAADVRLGAPRIVEVRSEDMTVTMGHEKRASRWVRLRVCEIRATSEMSFDNAPIAIAPSTTAAPRSYDVRVATARRRPRMRRPRRSVPDRVGRSARERVPRRRASSRAVQAIVTGEFGLVLGFSAWTCPASTTRPWNPIRRRHRPRAEPTSSCHRRLVLTYPSMRLGG